MIESYSNSVFKYLETYLQQKSQYVPRVTQKALKQSDKFPLVTVKEDDNKSGLITTNFEDTTDKIFFVIDIYAQDKAVGNSIISNVVIAKELSALVDDVMSKHYRMQRTQCRPTPNLDNSIYRITMKYTKKVITSKKLFI